MSKRKIDWRKIAFIVLMLLILGGITAYNANKNPEFMTASLVNILTLGVAVFFTFFYTAVMTDRRRRNDCIEHVLMEIKKDVEDKQLYSVDEDRSGYMLQRSCGNKIKYLCDAEFKNYNDEFQYIQQEFEEIRNLFSEHSSSQEEVEVVVKDIKRHIQNISDRCDKVRIMLYV